MGRKAREKEVEGGSGRHGQKRERERERVFQTFWKTVTIHSIPLILCSGRTRSLTRQGRLFLPKGTGHKQTTRRMCWARQFALRGGEGCVLSFYLKVEQTHSGLHEGDQANRLRQRPSFQVAPEPVDKLEMRRQSPRRQRCCYLGATDTKTIYFK